MIFNRLVFPYSASFNYPESSFNLFQLKTINQGLCSLIEVLLGWVLEEDEAPQCQSNPRA